MEENYQGRSQNLKEVPQNFNIDDVAANDAIQRNQHHKEKKINLSSIVITDVKLASVEERLRILFFICMARTLS